MPHVRFHASFAALAFLAGCGYPAPATPTQTNPQDFPPPAPWMETMSLAPSEDTERFAEALKHLTRQYAEPPSEASPLPPDFREHLLWVRDIGIPTMSNVPPLAWRWTAVGRAIRDLDRRIPVVWDPHEHDFIMGHDMLHGQIVAGPQALTESKTALFSDLLHETTHHVYDRLLLSTSGFTPREWAALITRCDDLWVFWQFANEVVALRNDFGWLVQNADAQGTKIRIRLGTASRTLDQALFHDRRAFADLALEAVPPRKRPTGIRCGPPIALRGPWVGQYIRPWEVATPEGAGREENIVSPYLASAYPELKRRAGIP